MKIKAKDFTDEQRLEFQEHFYDIMGSPEEIGTPWFWKANVEFEGDTIEQMANKHFKEYRKECKFRWYE